MKESYLEGSSHNKIENLKPITFSEMADGLSLLTDDYQQYVYGGVWGRLALHFSFK